MICAKKISGFIDHIFIDSITRLTSKRIII